MNICVKCAMAMTLALAAIGVAGVSAAMARGGGSNVTNSPGYQRRLQESRGYVTNQSGSLFSPAPAQPMTTAPVRKRPHGR